MGKFTISSCLTLLAFGITICLTLSGCSPWAVQQGSNALASTTENSPSLQDDQDEEAAKLLELELIGYQNALNGFQIIECEDAVELVEKCQPFFLIVGRSTCEWCRKAIPTLGIVFDDLGYSPYYIDSTETETDSELSEFREIYGVDTVPCLLRFDRSGHHTVVEINYQADDLRAEIETAIESIGGIESVR